MTRIRRINVSQVEGGGADNTNTDQIRPSGETAFYLDNNNKLTLMMFDGVRTHRDSKVLSPGVLYGSNADAGDGSGSDTIKLIPDAGLGTDQYIVVDPTGGVPGHIHLRAGGNQDNSGADLYLGGEQTFVRVSDTTDNVAIRTGLSAAIENIEVAVVDELVPPGDVWRLFINDSTYPTLGTTVQIGETVTTTWGTPVTATIVDIQQDAGNWQIHVDQNITVGHNPYNTVTFNRGSKTWTFGSTGDLTLPNDTVIRTDGSNVEVGGVTNFNVEAAGVVNIYTDTSGENPYQWQFGDNGALTLPNDGVVSAGGSGGLTLGGNFDVKIVADYTDNNRTWTFAGTDGSVTFPDNTVQETAWAGGRVVAVPAASTGATGDLQGDLAFNSSYIYYCTADFDTHESLVIVNSTEWGGTSGPLTTLPFFSLRAPQIGWTIDITFNSGPATLTITSVTSLGNDRYQVDFSSVGVVNASNGNTGTLTDNLPAADIWKRVAWSGDTW